ncbi:MAG: nanoRNase/pAp phosphatase (c-di-AMP/oligoRNAs hydrolase) [Planctomycetota bacterium]|jgi:nanoRNase/pAp phosphatase (c-di-AMP/oligoRNAs hydrolase)
MTKQAMPSARSSESDADEPETETAAQGLPVERLGRVLAQVSEEASGVARGRFLVLTHRGPDPDAMGACEGLRCLLTTGFGYEVTVATVGEVHRAENLALLRTLKLELEPYEDVDPSEYAGVLLADTQPVFGHTVVPEGALVAAVFDHHVPPKDEQTDRVPPRYEDVRLQTGATCSILYEYLRDAKIEIDTKTASALFCGIRYDTADLSRNASPLDEEAYTALFAIGDREAIARIDNPPLPRHYYSGLTQALTAARQHGPLVLILMGKVDNPESVAETADFFLRMKGCSLVLAGAAHGSEYILSLRTDYAFGKAYPLMSRMLDGLGSFGGHGHIAGARVQLEDDGMSSIKAVERKMRANALEVIGAEHEDGIPPEGKSLAE